MYSNSLWANEIASVTAELLLRECTVFENDVIIDFGCGPGLALREILRALNKTLSRTYATILAIDSSLSMINQCRELLSPRIRSSIRMSFVHAEAFEGENLKPEFVKLINDLPQISHFLSSLVLEYISDEQIIKLAATIIERLRLGGVLVFFDWAEHFCYPQQYANEIKHMRGFSKSDLLNLAARISEICERPERVLSEEMHRVDGFPLFPSKPEYLIKCTIGSFGCVSAATQGVPSGNLIHYLMIKKEEALSPIDEFGDVSDSDFQHNFRRKLPTITKKYFSQVERIARALAVTIAFYCASISVKFISQLRLISPESM